MFNMASNVALFSSVCAPRKDTKAFVNLRFETINMDQVVGTDGFV